jgi:hypothetical protein
MSGRSGLPLWWIKTGRFSTCSREMARWILNRRFRFARICIRNTGRSWRWIDGTTGRAFWPAFFFGVLGPLVSAALGEFCGRKMPAGTPALLCGPLMDAQIHYSDAVWEKHY